MKLLVCDNCGARHHSAAAESLAAAGARCERCGSVLVVQEPGEREAVPVGPETGPGRLRRPG
jgi:hypothetical protein